MIKKSVFIALFSLFNVFIGWAQTAHYNVVPLPKSIQYVTQVRAYSTLRANSLVLLSTATLRVFLAT